MGTIYTLAAIGRAAERLKDWIDRHAVWAVGGLSALYLGWTGALASRKAMWNDELYTYYIATLPDVSDIWSALSTGAEQIPPGFHLLTRGVLQVAGEGPIAVRIPEMLGFLVMMVCLYRFVARRTTPFYGLLAMVFPLVTGAYSYAYEARPYGLVLGLAGVALVSWQAAADGAARRLSLTLLTLSLGAALANHYYAVLILFALGVGELARSVLRRRVDPPIWVAFGVAAIPPLLAFGPLIRAAAGYSSAFWCRISLSQLPHFYGGILAPAEVPLGAGLLAGMAYAMYSTPAAGREARRRIPQYEQVVALAFAAVPAVMFAIALLVTKAFVSRYALIAVLGLGLLVAYGIHHLPRGRALVGATFLVVAGGWFAAAQYGSLRRMVAEAKEPLTSSALLQVEADAELPIVASEPHTFMSLAYYAPPAIAARLVYLGDPGASLRHLGHNSVERGMVDLVGPWFRLPVRDYGEYLATHPRFWVYGELGWLTWITRELQDTGARIEMRNQLGDRYLLLVTGPPSGAPGVDTGARSPAPASPPVTCR